MPLLLDADLLWQAGEHIRELRLVLGAVAHATGELGDLSKRWQIGNEGVSDPGAGNP